MVKHFYLAANVLEIVWVAGNVYIIGLTPVAGFDVLILVVIDCMIQIKGNIDYVVAL